MRGVINYWPIGNSHQAYLQFAPLRPWWYLRYKSFFCLDGLLSCCTLSAVFSSMINCSIEKSNKNSIESVDAVFLKYGRVRTEAIRLRTLDNKYALTLTSSFKECLYNQRSANTSWTQSCTFQYERKMNCRELNVIILFKSVEKLFMSFEGSIEESHR
jgi:hypothetical protein